MALKTDAEKRADAIFKARAEQKADAPRATQDYQSAQQATLDRTKRLREERLAREAADSDKSGDAIRK
jgi:hypothetical protein